MYPKNFLIVVTRIEKEVQLKLKLKEMVSATNQTNEKIQLKKKYIENIARKQIETLIENIGCKKQFLLFKVYT